MKNMKESNFVNALLLTMLCFMIGITGCQINAFQKENGEMKAKAIECGCAEYDPKTGEFKWKNK
jgi:hypothetical protein